jgi:acyl-CoA thioesterase YciA
MPDQKVPTGDLAIRTLAMPSDANPNGDIFGGWVVSHMDLAGLSVAQKYANRVTTVAINSMVFMAPVKVGDFICCYAELIKLGRTSITIKIETWALNRKDERRQVTEGIFTFVSIDEKGCPTPIKQISNSLNV